ncbi:ADP-ribosylation factor-like protein 9 isoform 2-T2 [Menidia menidia]
MASWVEMSPSCGQLVEPQQQRRVIAGNIVWRSSSAASCHLIHLLRKSRARRRTKKTTFTPNGGLRRVTANRSPTTMLGLREAGILSASVVLAGGVAYLIWSYGPSPSREDRDKGPGTAGKGTGGEEEKEKGARRAEATSQGAVIPAEAQKTSDKEKTSTPEEPRGTQVLVLGLEGAGKTSLLHCLSAGVLEQDIEPTGGFNAVSVNRDNLDVEFLEIGGGAGLRPYWQKYMSRALLLVFVVDSSDPKLFPVAKQHLMELLSNRPRLPLMVLANKQDLPGACSITELHGALELALVGERPLFLIGTQAGRGPKGLGPKGLGPKGVGSGVQDARDIILQLVGDSR